MIQKLSAHEAAYLMCLFTFEVRESNFASNRRLRQGSVETPRLWQTMATQLLVNVEDEWARKRMGLSSHQNTAFPTSPDISRKRAASNHPCVSWFSMMFATCLGRASSNAVLMSKHVRDIVGCTTLPCSNLGPLSCCHAQCLCSKNVPISYRCWQFIPCNPPTCNFFQFSGSLSFPDAE